MATPLKKDEIIKILSSYADLEVGNNDGMIISLELSQYDDGHGKVDYIHFELGDSDE